MNTADPVTFASIMLSDEEITTDSPKLHGGGSAYAPSSTSEHASETLWELNKPPDTPTPSNRNYQPLTESENDENDPETPRANTRQIPIKRVTQPNAAATKIAKRRTAATRVALT